MARLTSKQRRRGLTEGWRSGLEERIAAELTEAGVPFTYEAVRIKYDRKPATYTPDFILKNGIIIETKGRFVGADRTKHLLVKQQHPDLDIRFVFSNSRTRLSKSSSTTYADWCHKNGFKFADKHVPEAWINEKR